MNRTILAVWVACLLGGVESNVAFAADCAHPTPIRFARSANSATVHGGIVRAEDVCYVLSARAGQHLDATLSSPDENVVFSAYRPGYHVATGSDGADVTGATLPGAGDQDDAAALHVTVPATGNYLFLLGTTRGGGGTYHLRVQVR
jgi:hypothetical protein